MTVDFAVVSDIGTNRATAEHKTKACGLNDTSKNWKPGSVLIVDSGSYRFHKHLLSFLNCNRLVAMMYPEGGNPHATALSACH